MQVKGLVQFLWFMQYWGLVQFFGFSAVLGGLVQFFRVKAVFEFGTGTKNFRPVLPNKK